MWSLVSSACPVGPDFAARPVGIAVQTACLEPMPRAISASARSPSVLLSGFYGVRNLGDELMLRCLVRWMDAAAPRVTVLSERPDECERLSRLPAIRNVPLLGQWAWFDAWGRGSAWRLIRQVGGFDALIGGGGDVLRDDRGWRHLSFATEKYFVAAAFGRPWYVLNAGIGPPSTFAGRRALGWVLRHARQVIVRDRQAYDVALATRDPAETWYAGDIVLALPRLFPGECAAAVAPPSTAGSPYVLVCLRGQADTFGRFGLPEARLRELAAALDALAATGHRIAFLPFQQHETEDDDTLHRAVAARMRRRAHVVHLPWSADIGATAAVFRGASLVVAMRLHAAVLGEAFGAPTAVLAYDRKLVAFARQRGVPAIHADELDRPGTCAARLADTRDGARGGAGEPPPHDWLQIPFRP
jgi:polysaccharide pyruvyl transferase CsaB